jgi:hypothetical protein
MSMDSSELVWQKLGFPREILEGCARNLILLREQGTWSETPPTNPDDVEIWAGTINTWDLIAFSMQSMGYDALSKPFDNKREIATRITRASMEYFFGGWRTNFRRFGWCQMDHVQARRELPWSDIYRKGLAMAATIGAWNSVDRLMNWLAPDLKWDRGTDDRTRADNACHILLALRIQGAIPSAALPCRQLVEQSNRKRALLLLDCIDDLFSENVSRLATALAKYLRVYLAKEVTPNRPQSGVCLDATLIWHLARHRGMGELSLPGNLAILIAN